MMVRVLQYLGKAVGPQQCAFMTEVLANMANVLRFPKLLPYSRVFDRLPVRHVTQFAFTKDTIQHSRGAEQTDVSTMQRREWPAGYVGRLPQ